jgi:hypothetical protein
MHREGRPTLFRMLRGLNISAIFSHDEHTMPLLSCHHGGLVLL